MNSREELAAAIPQPAVGFCVKDGTRRLTTAMMPVSVRMVVSGIAQIARLPRAIAVVRAVHRHVTGTTTDGRPYRADDPHLITWVHVAEIDSFLTAHQLFGRRPLTAAETDAYVAQTAEVARRLGGERVPTTHAQLVAAIERYRPEL